MSTEPFGSSASLVDKVVPWHFSLLLVFTTWAFGGQAPWAREIIAWLGGAGIGLFVWALWAGRRSSERRSSIALRLLWPLLCYDVVVVASCFNPGMIEISVEGQRSLMIGDPNPWLPSAAVPRLAAAELWQFNGLVLSAFNLLLVLRRRSQVRRLLFLLAGNAAVLAVFGTFQKLVGAKGLWFGLVTSPNPRFFSTFIYHNHWGAYILLNIAVCLALLFHLHRRGGHRDVWHSPVLLGAVVTLLLATTIPLSASRSCTVLVGLLLGGALVHALSRVIQSRRTTGRSALAPVAAIILTAVLAAGAVGFLGRHAIAERARQTATQLDGVADGSTVRSRLTLYHDTWNMTTAKPWFGWGLESYAYVFRIFNTQRTVELQWWRVFYAEAHNDWLQSLAEVGFVGTGLLVSLGLLPLLAVPWRRTDSVVPRYLLTGCGFLLLYAWLEFPFANPAVLLTFCAVFYCAVRYAALDARTQSNE